MPLNVLNEKGYAVLQEHDTPKIDVFKYQKAIVAIKTKIFWQYNVMSCVAEKENKSFITYKNTFSSL